MQIDRVEQESVFSECRNEGVGASSSLAKEKK